MMKNSCFLIVLLFALVAIPQLSAKRVPDSLYIASAPDPTPELSVDPVFLEDLTPEARQIYINILKSKRPTLSCICRSEEPVPHVCGVDGVEYVSECAATCRRIKVDCEGSCPCKDKHSHDVSK